MKKFNGFENWIITEAVNHFITLQEASVTAMEKQGKNSLFAPGYFTMVGKDLLRHVDDLTKKKDLKKQVPLR